LNTNRSSFFFPPEYELILRDRKTGNGNFAGVTLSVHQFLVNKSERRAATAPGVALWMEDDRTNNTERAKLLIQKDLQGY